MELLKGGEVGKTIEGGLLVEGGGNIIFWED